MLEEFNIQKNYAANAAFAECSECSKIWKSKKDFLKDTDITIAGYIANFTDYCKGTFLFAHNCKGFINLPVEKFLDIYREYLNNQTNKETTECPGYCDEHHTLSHCISNCNTIMIKEIIQNFVYFNEKLK